MEKKWLFFGTVTFFDANYASAMQLSVWLYTNSKKERNFT